jgi:hypothetical protein
MVESRWTGLGGPSEPRLGPKKFGFLGFFIRRYASCVYAILESDETGRVWYTRRPPVGISLWHRKGRLRTIAVDYRYVAVVL